MYQTWMRKIGQKQWTRMRPIRTMPGVKNGQFRTKRAADFFAKIWAGNIDGKPSGFETKVTKAS